MSNIPLLVAEKWQLQSPELRIPNYGMIMRPNNGKHVHTKDEFIAYWLLKNNYCIADVCIRGNIKHDQN